jgi:Ras-related protein Rab-5C
MNVEDLSTRCKRKVVFMGPSLAGKTSIVLRFSKGTFSPNGDMTVGSALVTRDIQTSKGLVTLHIWDTAGQECYKSLIPRYSRGASAILTVFDVTSPDSYKGAQEILSDEEYMESSSKIQRFLIGNKMDESPVVDLWNVRRYAESVKATYFETSAKTGDNINQLFVAVAEKVAQMAAEEDGVPLEPAEPSHWCC